MIKRPIQVMAAVAAGLACVCSAAATANADGYARRPVAAPPAFSWTGFYLGVNGGYGWSDDQTVRMNETLEFPTVAPFLYESANFGSLAMGGGFFGIQAGANLQLGIVVLGFEVDGQWSDIQDSSFAALTLRDGPYTCLSP